MNPQETILDLELQWFRTSMIISNLCDYCDAYIHVKGTIRVPNTGAAADPNNRNKKVKLKNYAPVTNCIS